MQLPVPKKHIEWVGSAKKDLRAFPDAAQHDIGFALMHAQFGSKHKDAKPWKGLGPGVMEIAIRHNTDAYRAIYTVNIGDTIYVLHAFQKKSKHGIATPPQEIELIRARYKKALEMSKRKV